MRQSDNFVNTSDFIVHSASDVVNGESFDCSIFKLND